MNHCDRGVSTSIKAHKHCESSLYSLTALRYLGVLIVSHSKKKGKRKFHSVKAEFAMHQKSGPRKYLYLRPRVANVQDSDLNSGPTAECSKLGKVVLNVLKCTSNSNMNRWSPSSSLCSTNCALSKVTNVTQI